MTKKTFGGDDFGLGSTAAKSETNSARTNRAEKPLPIAAATVKPFAASATTPSIAHQNTPVKPQSGNGYTRNTFSGTGNFKQVAFNIDKQLALQFKLLCVAQDISASAVINDFIGQYLKENGK